MNHSVDQDGFAVLYDLTARCHPHLIAWTSRYNRYNSCLQMMPDDNIYKLKQKYETRLKIEKVDSHVYANKCVLWYIMQDLQHDTRYEKPLRQLEVELSTHTTMKHQTANYIPFPSDLLLSNLPQTIMACYDEEE